MSDQPKEVEKTRISVTLTRPYVDALDRLVEEGIYLSKGEIIMEALRRLFRRHGLEPFRLLEGPLEESGEEVSR